MRLAIIALPVALGAGTAGAFAAEVCPDVHAPVCAVKSGGQRANYGNSCRATQGSARILHDGKCEALAPMSMCSHLYKPVCALDPAADAQKTYPNLCTAERANAKSLHDGACAASGAQ